jgi:hypothetical protein
VVRHGAPAAVAFLSAAATNHATTMPQTQSDRRSILGCDGSEWLVREFETGNAGSASRSLVFERPEVVRRVRDYPRNWASLTDEQLYRLSLRT